MSKPYIINDANGNPINAKYPPNREKYGDLYEGYKTWAEVSFPDLGWLQSESA